MTIIVDKRSLPKNTTAGSRQKFIDRYKGAIKKRIKEIVTDGSIKDFGKGDKKVKINRKDLDEPSFEFEQGAGKTERIYVGNKKFKKGDTADRPRNIKGQGSQAGFSGGGDDDFEFILTEKEFRDLFFEDLELPDMVKKQFTGSAYEIQHAGYSRSGGPSSLNVKKTMLNSLGRRLAMRKKSILEANDYLNKLSEEEFKKVFARQAKHGTNISKLEKKIQYIEDIDLRYNFKEKIDMPSSRAVMFCLMDVSGSMGEKQKDISKRFYILLNMFLKRNYKIVDVVFVRYMDMAEEVDEQKFFYGTETGGTIVSTGYKKVNEIINSRYDSEQWNIYIAQATDGDNWPTDNEEMLHVLNTKLLPVTQYFAYIDVGKAGWNSERKSDLLEIMEKQMLNHKNLQVREVNDYNEIFSVFQSLFKKKD
jgi:uncharacterized sporulation protein YeaH/YhbH (DUF444 family)